MCKGMVVVLFVTKPASTHFVYTCTRKSQVGFMGFFLMLSRFLSRGFS